MVEETVMEALRRAGQSGTIGILGTTGTLKSGIYSKRVEKLGGRSVTLLDLENGDSLQETLTMEPIFGRMQNGERAGGGIKSGKCDDPHEKERLAKPLRRAAKHLADRGADLVLTACTEIPLATGRIEADGVPLLDPMEVAAKACVEIATGERPLPD
jgi:aspartate racemase